MHKIYPPPAGKSILFYIPRLPSEIMFCNMALKIHLSALYQSPLIPDIFITLVFLSVCISAAFIGIVSSCSLSPCSSKITILQKRLLLPNTLSPV